ncbi:glycosyltransferase family 41 protein [Saccharata proteae CBS 121410]|uniref:protein O-GlcNAc transferase n=1 Tax=Saccharata proteae CBS 121410 TaxID=1314787 RepID=A0A6A5YF67_9PEZI|nr:glycosyltransferase family 41 protein [Saccharata proteae CBS 121410]
MHADTQNDPRWVENQPQPPQQYAHPLQRNTSYLYNGSPKSGHVKTEHSENMLRRKTPNGILAAAYDGTSVEQTEKPHAMKHIILPVTTAELGSIDSMLNQMQTHHPHMQFQQMGQQYHGVMQPSLHGPLGPTVSNDIGPYGPYWPGGAFVPYRPVAMRDPRYYPPAAPWPQQHIPYSSNGNGDCTMCSKIPMLEYGPQSNNAQLREKVLDWAHQIYVDLLAYLHQTRRHGYNTKHLYGQPSQPSIYPKPPRQPGADFSLYTIKTVGYHGTSLSEMVHTCIQWDRSPIPIMPCVGLAHSALDKIFHHCQDSSWQWIDGMLVGGCLAYALGDYQKALGLYSKILKLDKDHVEAISNLAATLLALGRKLEAERCWRQAVSLRPSFFEAVEHLVGLLCGDHRGKEAIAIIEQVEQSLRYVKRTDPLSSSDRRSDRSSSNGLSPLSENSDKPLFDFDGERSESESGQRTVRDLPGSGSPGFGSSGYAIPGSDNGRILSLIHAKGNMLYTSGDNVGAAQAFENAVLIAAGLKTQDGSNNGIGALIRKILAAVDREETDASLAVSNPVPSREPILLPPAMALNTAKLCFAPHGELPGLRYVTNKGMARKAAISTTSNSLLSLAKIFQDGMASASAKTAFRSIHGVREILALYYLSLSLQPSPSTANNVGILLASVQQTVAPRKQYPVDPDAPRVAGIAPGSGVALALAYYNYGLNLDRGHAHLYTNFGSLLKDIGQLKPAIQMYERAVACDGNFDIALANLANAVKDDGRISDAITYYRRAVNASPDFAEAVCGLANALNSVCGWAGRGGIAADGGRRDRWHVDDNGMLLDSREHGAKSSGWIKRVVDLVEKQLADGEDWGRGTLDSRFIDSIMRQLSITSGNVSGVEERKTNARKILESWSCQKWEGARLVRLAERATRRLIWQWYQDKYVKGRERPTSVYSRPLLPPSITVPGAPTVLPFHTFTCPMSAKQIRLISQRNGLRISCSTLKAPWLPLTVLRPPPPPNPYLRVGYVSSDFNNHPLAHLMQSVFGLHDTAKVKAFCYATTASDNSPHRQQIEREAPMFYDASSWSAEKLVHQIVHDGIHILVNLNGYTRGARNEVFAARPAPIQMSFMGFAGTLGAEWCDYLLADDTAIPVNTLRPWRRNVDLEDQLVDENSGGDQEDWVYGENIIFCKDTFFCCDHRQSAPDAHGKQLSWEEEQLRRWKMRKEIFPSLPDDVIVLGNFNQLYKIDPTTFRSWLRILARLPKAILWLLRFPDVGETHLKQTAHQWAGSEVASRVIFTDVAPKHQHIARARVCDLFLDTPECNAHTTAADVLWSGTPLLTLPRYPYKMCSRMAASILKGALPNNEAGKQAATELIAKDEEDYEEKAIRLGKTIKYEGHRARGRLSDLRKLLYEARWSSALFDTARWVRDLEEAYDKAWNAWVKGEGGDIWLEGSRPKVQSTITGLVQ